MSRLALSFLGSPHIVLDGATVEMNAARFWPFLHTWR